MASAASAWSVRTTSTVACAAAKRLDEPRVAVRDLLGQVPCSADQAAQLLPMATLRPHCEEQLKPGLRVPRLGRDLVGWHQRRVRKQAGAVDEDLAGPAPTSCRSSRLTAPSSSADSPASLASRSAHVSGPLPGSLTERPLRCRSSASMTGATSSQIFARRVAYPGRLTLQYPYHCHSLPREGVLSPRRSSAPARRRRRSWYSFDALDAGATGRYRGQERRLPLKLVDQRAEIGQVGLWLAAEGV